MVVHKFFTCVLWWHCVYCPIGKFIPFALRNACGTPIWNPGCQRSIGSMTNAERNHNGLGMLRRANHMRLTLHWILHKSLSWLSWYPDKWSNVRQCRAVSSQLAWFPAYCKLSQETCKPYGEYIHIILFKVLQHLIRSLHELFLGFKVKGECWIQIGYTSQNIT